MAGGRGGRQPGDPMPWDRLPLWLPLLVGIAAGCALGWAALQGVGGGVLLLGLVLLPLVAWQGARLRLVIAGLPEVRSRTADEAPQPASTVERVVEKQPGVPGPALASGASGLRPVQVPGMNRVLLSGGRFMMGSDPAIDKLADDDEQPRHGVLLSPFEIADRPVTRELYRRVMGADSGGWEHGSRQDLPATDLSWFDALRFCNKLSREHGLSECYREYDDGDWRWPDRQADGFRLPTEAEWEYACRAGSESAWFWGDSPKQAKRHAWFADNSDSRVRPVAGLDANPWGLYDMAGNTREWCWDWYGGYDSEVGADPIGPASGRRRVLRGGAFVNSPRGLRSALRSRNVPGDPYWFIGFRCVRGSARSIDPSNS